MENISIAKRTTDLGIDKNKAKLQNLGQTSTWFCLAKGEKYIGHLWQINVTTPVSIPA